MAPAPPGIRRPAWPLYTAFAVDAVGTGLYVPLSMIFFLRTTDVPLATIGLLISVANACSLPLPLLVGKVVDRLGPRRVVITGQAVQALGFLLYLGVDGAAGLFTAVLVECLGLRMYWSSVFALIASQAEAGVSEPSADRASGADAKDRWFARAGMIRAGGLGAGTLLAGAALAVESTAAYRGIVLADAMSFVAAAVIVGAFVRDGDAARPASPRRHSGYASLRRDRPYLALIAVNAAFTLCSVFLGVSLPVYATEGLDAPGWLASVLLALNTAVLATVTGAVTVAARRRGSRARAMAWSGRLWTLWCAGAAAALLVPSGPLLIICLTLVTLCYTAAEMLHETASNALSAEAAPEGSRGVYLAAFQYSFVTGLIVAPGLFGVLFSRAPALPWVAVGGLALLASVAMGPLERRLRAG